MAYFRCGGGGIPSSLKTDMNAVYNKKFGTSTTYDPSVWASTANLMGPLPEKTASGSVANITDGADRVPIKNWGVTVDATLSGVSSVVCSQAGKNLLAKDIVRYSNSLATLSECFAIHHGTYTATIGTVANANNWRLSVLLMDGEGNALTDNAYKPSNDLQLATNRWRFGSNTTTKVFTVTIVTDCYVRFFIELGDTSSSTTVTDSYLEVGSTSTTYTPYTAPTVTTVPLGRTIYGGQADVVNGTGVESEKQVKFSDLNWTYQSNYNRFRTQDLTAVIAKPATNQTVLTGLLSSAYTAGVANSSYATDQSIAVNVSGEIFVYDSNYTDKDVWLAQVGNDTISYPLATPENFTFTPITPTPETALGVNNFWADEGDSDVTYRADIDLLLGGN